MNRRLPISKLRIWQLAIPMRQAFSHSAATRAVAEPLIVEIELADHSTGFGETHPRTYVTGESMDQAITTIRHVLAPLLLETGPSNFVETLEVAAGLPFVSPQTQLPITAARAAVELALLDAYGRAFGRSPEIIAGWLDEAKLGPPGSSLTARFSGVISNKAPRRIPWSLRKMRLLRLTHFKLKIGDRDDDERLRLAIKTLGGGLDTGRITLRADANGAWGLEQAGEKLAQWQDWPLLCVEQPLPKTATAEMWGDLACRTTLPLMADESLVLPEDAASLASSNGAAWFNIRISKNGGLIPAMQMAMFARKNQIDFQLGCMVGETGILSAAGRWFLQLVSGVQIAEGSFGRFLLHEDIVNETIRFGLGGRWKTLQGPGLGVTINREGLENLAIGPPIEIPF